MKEKCGVIYILTNPSFPEYIKIGYADGVDTRVKQLNNSEAVPFSFHIYATFDVTERLTDMKLHKFIDTINPELRSKERIGDKIRVREFYHMSPEEMYSAFESMAEINGTIDRLHLLKKTNEEIEDKKEALMLSKNKRHFKNISFHSSLTGKNYYSKTNEGGTLGIYEKDTNIEVPNSSNPSKRQTLYSALEDSICRKYFISIGKHKLEKILVSRK